MTGKQFGDWMDSAGMSLQEAASYFGVSEGTVYKWRSTPGVPPSRLEWVEQRMRDFIANKGIETLPDRVTIEISAEQFDEWNRASLAEGKILREWAIDILDDAAAEEGLTGSADPPYPVQSTRALRVADSTPLDRSKLDAIQRGGAAARAEKLRRQLDTPAPQPKEPANGEAEATK